MSDTGLPFQTRVRLWVTTCFGSEAADDAVERTYRFLEESIKLSQAMGCSAADAHALVDYVYGRPTGEVPQEVGGVMTTLASLCASRGIDMDKAGEIELGRCWMAMDKIRAKQASKTIVGPLPGASPTADHAAELSDHRV